MSGDTKAEEAMRGETRSLLASVSKEDVEKNLSKVLFNETTDKVKLLDKERTLRPIPIKYAKQISAKLIPFSLEVQEAFNKQEAKDLNAGMMAALTDAANIIASFYKWDDVLKAISDEEITTAEMQSLCISQVNLNGNNDFLLRPLSLVIEMMRMIEAMSLKFKSMSTSQR
jgi:hypothetical protein